MKVSLSLLATLVASIGIANVSMAGCPGGSSAGAAASAGGSSGGSSGGASASASASSTTGGGRYTPDVVKWSDSCVSSGGGATVAPELDPTSSIAALTLFAGSVVLLAGRRFRRAKAGISS